MINSKLITFIRERDEMLLRCDIDEMLGFYRKYKPNLPMPSSRHVAELMLHKARTGATSLPIEERRKSKIWLEANGSSSLDNGDL